ncbi:CCC1, partial [Symbiodinium sp. CCMP2592]
CGEQYRVFPKECPRCGSVHSVSNPLDVVSWLDEVKEREAFDQIVGVPLRRDEFVPPDEKTNEIDYYQTPPSTLLSTTTISRPGMHRLDVLRRHGRGGHLRHGWDGSPSEVQLFHSDAFLTAAHLAGADQPETPELQVQDHQALLSSSRPTSSTTSLSEGLAKILLKRKDFDHDSCHQLLEVVKLRKPGRQCLSSNRARSGTLTLGYYSHGKQLGFTNDTMHHKHLARYLGRYLRHHGMKGDISSLFIACNVHSDLWVEAEAHDCKYHLMQERRVHGRRKLGYLLDTRRRLQSFYPHLYHGSDDFTGNRFVITAYQTRLVDKAPEEHLSILREMGFRSKRTAASADVLNTDAAAKAPEETFREYVTVLEAYPVKEQSSSAGDTERVVALESSSEEEGHDGSFETRRAELQARKKEIHWRSLTEEEVPCFVEAVQKEWSEWQRWSSCKAVQVREGEVPSHLILKSRLCYRWKPVPEGQRAKARIVIAGFRDPHLAILTRDAPVLAREPDTERPEQIFMRAPADPIALQANPEWRCKTLLYKLSAPVYGQSNAPRRWYDHFSKVMRKLGWTQHSLDPCLFLWRVGSQIGAVLGLHVDDLIAAALTEYEEVLNKVEASFTWGSPWVSEEFTFIGRKVKQHPDGSVTIDQSTYVGDIPTTKVKLPEDTLLSLHPSLETWRRMCPLFRSPRKMADLREVNSVLRYVKATPEAMVRIVHVPLESLIFVAYGDSGFANAPNNKSQGGLVIVATDRCALREPCEASLLEWKSYRHQRVLRSTLAAEASALDRSHDHARFMAMVFSEMVYGDYIATVNERAKHEVVPVTDARSLWDAVHRLSTSFTEKRVEIDVAALRQTCQGLRWVPTEQMHADCMTKRSRSLRDDFRQWMAQPMVTLVDSKSSKDVAVGSEANVAWRKERTGVYTLGPGSVLQQFYCKSNALARRGDFTDRWDAQSRSDSQLNQCFHTLERPGSRFGRKCACEKSRFWRRALHLRLGEDAYRANTIGWNAAASACVDVWPQGLALLDTMPAMEVLPDTISHNIGLGLSPSWACALRFPPSPDSVTFGTAITGLKQGRRWRFATLLLGSMAILRVQEVCRSFSSCSSACEQEALWEPVLALLRQMRIVSIRGDEVGMNSLISACGQHGHWGLALGALHGMPGGQLPPDQISMNSMIAACRTGALWRLALRLLCSCMLVELLPSAVTFNSLLGAVEPETSWPRLLASLNHMREYLVSPSIISFNTGVGRRFLDSKLSVELRLQLKVPDAPPQELPRTLWVGDVELWMDERYVSKCFEGTGQLRNIKLVRRPFSCNFAFIEFAQHEDAAAFLASLGGQPFRCALGHSFRVNWASSGGAFGERERERYKMVSLYVGNLDACVRDADLKKLFERYRSLSHARVITDPVTSLSKGFGFVRFREGADAEQALREMQGIILGSKSIKVKPATRMEGRDRDGSLSQANAANSLKAICVGGLEQASLQDRQLLLQRCAAFGVMRRYNFFEGCCLIEFQEWAAAEAAAAHMAGDWGLPVQPVDGSTASYYLQLAQVWQPSAEAGTAVANLTTSQAEHPLADPAEPGLEHFKALLKDPRFVRIFESIRQSSQGTVQSKPAPVRRWSMLLEDKPEFFGRPSHEFMQQSDVEMLETFRDVDTKNDTKAILAKGRQRLTDVLAGTCNAAEGKKWRGGAHALQQRMSRDFHSKLCNGMVRFSANQGKTEQAERWMSHLNHKRGDVPEVDAFNKLLQSLIDTGDLDKLLQVRSTVGNWYATAMASRAAALEKDALPASQEVSFSRKSTFTEESDAPRWSRSWGAANTPRFLGNEVISTSADLKNHKSGVQMQQPKKDKKGALSGVFVPTCENMWGVLIFLRFYYIVGQAGIWQTLCAVGLSFAAAFCTTAAMSSIASSGGLVSSGGPYYMISRALGPVVGATIGVMYWLAITMLSVLECLGAVEALAMAAPSVQFPGYRQAIGSGLMATLALAVWGGINIVTKLGLFFALVVVYTLFSFYLGLFQAGPSDGLSPGSEMITGLSWETFQANWGPHYDPGINFGVVLSLFYPCFTGILSGANRADVLKDPPRNIRLGTFAAILFSLVLYSSFFLLWGSVASDKYLKGDFLGHEPHHGRRLSSAGISPEASRHIVQTVVWNPFPNSAFIGIILASLSQSLQCLIVAPRLLQNMAKDRLMPALRVLEPLSSSGEPTRALLFTYLAAALLVLIGQLELVAPLLTMLSDPPSLPPRFFFKEVARSCHFLARIPFMNASVAYNTHGRRPSHRDAGGVRECIEGRFMNHAATTGRAAVGAKGRGQESAKELLQQLPVALGGYRPGHNDTAPGPKQRVEAQRQAPRGPSHEPPWMQQNRRGARADVAVVPPWAQDTFTMPFPRKREGEAHRKRHQSLPEEAIRPKNGDTTLFGAPAQDHHHHAAHAHQHVPHLPKARDGAAVAFVSKAAEPNSQYRAYMEDKYCIIDPFMDGELGNETWAFFAVYDGHGGVLAAEHCEAELHKVLASELRHALKSAPKRPSSPLRDEVVAEALTRTFQKADDQLRQVGAWRFGCTATVALVRRLPQGMRVHVTWAAAVAHRFEAAGNRPVADDGGRLIELVVWRTKAEPTIAQCHTHSHAASSCSAFARLSGNDQCCYCALKSLFHEFAVSDRDVLPPDALRKALSLAYNVQGRFQTGDMEDATETIEVILGILHACSLSSSLAPSASPRAQCVHAEFIEEASRFGCHPLCLSHEVFGVEYVDVPRCTFCGATGEPTVTSAFTYGVYVTELLECREDLAGQVDSEGASVGLWQSIHLVPPTRRASLQQVLRKLCQLRGGNCSECNSRHTLVTERFLTRQPQTFLLSLAWPSSSPTREQLIQVLSMIQARLYMTEIFETSAETSVVYGFRGLVCYSGMHYVALFWCPSQRHWVLFDDTCVQEKEDWSSAARVLLSGLFVPTLAFYERVQADAALEESLEDLAQQVANVGDSRAITVDGSGGSTRLSVDHRPTDAAEARRIREEGGFVTMGRVSGELAVSRALGDLLLKSSGLSCKPSVRAHDAKRDLALVLASDGLWDFAEEKEVAKVVVSCSSLAHDDACTLRHKIPEPTDNRGRNLIT